MPQMTGAELCERIKQNQKDSYTYVILITSRSDAEDIIQGLESGADDYITKPFSMSVLYAKTMALIKRNQRTVLSGDRMEACGITLELSTRKVWAGRKEVTVTPKEFAILRCLMQNKNIVMSREQLLVKCWGYDYEGEARVVDTHIKRLREKIHDHDKWAISTIWGIGYKFEIK